MKYTKNIEIPVDNLYRKIPILVKQNDYNSRFFSVKLTANGAALTSEAFGTVNEVAIGITRGDKQKKRLRGRITRRRARLRFRFRSGRLSVRATRSRSTLW